LTFETKSSMLSLKDERQWTGYLWLRKKEGHYIREYILCKKRLDRKSTQDIYPRRVDKAIRVHFEKCLLCTLYQEEFILSSFKVVISQYMFILTNVGLSMCVMEYSDWFLNFDMNRSWNFCLEKYEITRMTG